MATVSKSERREAIERLREYVKPGDTLFTDLKHVSRSGMQRTIQILKFENNEPSYLGWNAAKACGNSYDERREGVKIGGCGMDMGFALVYELSSVLFPDGFDCTGENCPSNDHVNRVTPPENACTGNETCRNLNCVPWHHKEGGYALKHRWL